PTLLGLHLLFRHMPAFLCREYNLYWWMKMVRKSKERERYPAIFVSNSHGQECCALPGEIMSDSEILISPPLKTFISQVMVVYVMKKETTGLPAGWMMY